MDLGVFYISGVYAQRASRALTAAWTAQKTLHFTDLRSFHVFAVVMYTLEHSSTEQSRATCLNMLRSFCTPWLSLLCSGIKADTLSCPKLTNLESTMTQLASPS